MPSIEVDLRSGLTLPDKSGRGILYRFIQPTDDADAITDMLHEAYAPLLAAGMRYVASHQDAATTSRRMGKGDTVVAIDGQAVVGIITLQHISSTVGSPFYERGDVAGVSQFAVRPSWTGVNYRSVVLAKPLR